MAKSTVVLRAQYAFDNSMSRGTGAGHGRGARARSTGARIDLRAADGRVRINPPMSTVIAPGTRSPVTPEARAR